MNMNHVSSMSMSMSMAPPTPTPPPPLTTCCQTIVYKINCVLVTFHALFVAACCRVAAGGCREISRNDLKRSLIFKRSLDTNSTLATIKLIMSPIVTTSRVNINKNAMITSGDVDLTSTIMMMMMMMISC